MVNAPACPLGRHGVKLWPSRSTRKAGKKRPWWDFNVKWDGTQRKITGLACRLVSFHYFGCVFGCFMSFARIFRSFARISVFAFIVPIDSCPVVHHVVWLRHNNRRVPQRAMPGEFTHTRADHIDSDHFNNDWALRGPLSLSAAMPASEPAFGAAQESLSCGGYALFEQRLPECSDV